MSVLDHQDKLDYLMAKVTVGLLRKANVGFKNSKIKNTCINLYVVFFS